MLSDFLIRGFFIVLPHQQYPFRVIPSDSGRIVWNLHMASSRDATPNYPIGIVFECVSLDVVKLFSYAGHMLACTIYASHMRNDPFLSYFWIKWTLSLQPSSLLFLSLGNGDVVSAIGIHYCRKGIS